VSFACVLAGLGNPGRAYHGTRHNAGAAFVSYLAECQGVTLDTEKYRSLVGRGQLANHACLFALPQTFMNLSGHAVKRMLSYTGTPVSALVAVHDDLDLPLGRIRLRVGGGAGGHRGVQSIIDLLQTRDFLRLKIGIGRPPEGTSAERYVLAKFPAADRKVLAEAHTRAREAVETAILEGPAKAMSLFNNP
jgi:PTH1 family peptidyl-tRNA hydrolase